MCPAYADIFVRAWHGLIMIKTDLMGGFIWLCIITKTYENFPGNIDFLQGQWRSMWKNKSTQQCGSEAVAKVETRCTFYREKTIRMILFFSYGLPLLIISNVHRIKSFFFSETIKLELSRIGCNGEVIKGVIPVLYTVGLYLSSSVGSWRLWFKRIDILK